jgi:hypothetical protein
MEYDDQVDSTSQALDWSKQGTGRLGYVELLKKINANGGVHALFGGGNNRPGFERISSDQQARKTVDLKTSSANRIQTVRLWRDHDSANSGWAPMYAVRRTVVASRRAAACRFLFPRGCFECNDEIPLMLRT